MVTTAALNAAGKCHRPQPLLLSNPQPGEQMVKWRPGAAVNSAGVVEIFQEMETWGHLPKIYVKAFARGKKKKWNHSKQVGHWCNTPASCLLQWLLISMWFSLSLALRNITKAALINKPLLCGSSPVGSVGRRAQISPRLKINSAGRTLVAFGLTVGELSKQKNTNFSAQNISVVCSWSVVGALSCQMRR